MDESHGSPQSQIDGEMMESGAREGFRMLIQPDDNQDYSAHIIQEENNGDMIGDIDVGFFTPQRIDLKKFFPIQFQPMFLDGDIIEKGIFLLVEVSTTITKHLKDRMKRKAFCWWQLFEHFQCRMHIIYLFNRVEKELWTNIWEAIPNWFKREIEKRDRKFQFSIIWAPHFVVASWPKDIQNEKKDIENTILKSEIKEMKQRIKYLENFISKQ